MILQERRRYCPSPIVVPVTLQQRLETQKRWTSVKTVWPLAQLYRFVLTPHYRFNSNCHSWHLPSPPMLPCAGIAMATLDCFSFLSIRVYGVNLNGFP